MSLRLTKNQRAYQEEVLEANGMTGVFKPSSKLIGELAEECKKTRIRNNNLRDKLLSEIAAYKSKSLWRIFRERYL